MEINTQALRMSVLTGVATGIGSLGLYMYLAAESPAEEEPKTVENETGLPDETKLRDFEK